MNWISSIGAVALSICVAQGAIAQEESSNVVGENTDWNVFIDDNPTECWAVSAPKETVNTRGGQVVAATRGQILLMVFYRPSANARGQVAFTGGYPFRENSTVALKIDGTDFELFIDGEWAWPATSAEDERIVRAMKRGSRAIITGISTRGTTTKDTFSLLGFTAAVEDAEARCSS